MGYDMPEKFRPPSPPEPLPEGALTITWTGTAGFRIVHSGHTVLIDPFVTRCGLLRIPFTRLAVNEPLAAEVFPEAQHILLGHCHYDHLLDVPSIALRTGAVVHGSSSTAAVCRSAGVPEDHIRVHEPREWFDCGAFRGCYAPSLHGKAFLGRVPYPGEIIPPVTLPMKASGYKHGGAYVLLLEFSGFRIAHMGSADLLDDELERVGPVDLLLIGLAGRKGTPDFLRRVVSPLKPRFILPHHYDNFFSPLRKGLRFLPSIRVPDFLDETAAVCPYIRVLMPGFFEPVAFDPANKTLL